MSKLIAKQYRKPSGLLGKIISGRMERKNAKLYQWIMPRVKTVDGDHVLEIGYGAGTGINILAGRDQNITVSGIDFSKVMYKKALRKNKDHIGAGTVFLSHDDLLTYNSDNSQKCFSKIIGINVLYFWNDLGTYFSKIYGLLKDGGLLYLYMASPSTLDNLSNVDDEIFNKYTLDEVVGKLSASNFKDIHYEIHERENIERAYLIMAARKRRPITQ